MSSYARFLAAFPALVGRAWWFYIFSFRLSGLNDVVVSFWF
jgi:hypothetical protein